MLRLALYLPQSKKYDVIFQLCTTCSFVKYPRSFFQRAGQKKGQFWHITVADPGFPLGGGANSPGGAPTYDFVKFCMKLKEFGALGGARVQNFTM